MGATIGLLAMIVNFVWPSSAQYTGGVVALYEFANALCRRDHEVHFIHGPSNPYRVDHLDQIEWFSFDPRMVHHVVDSLDDPALPVGDVAFSPSAPERLGQPVAIVQGFGMMASTVERDVFRTRCLKVCVARWLIDVGVDLGSPREQLVHVPYGIDQALFRRTVALDDRPVDVSLLYNGHRAKGFPVAVDALTRVRDDRPDLQVEVFGILSPPFELPSWMHFNENPTRRFLVEDIYNRTKVFLQPSWVEGFGFTAVEAMATGCALVTTDNGGSRDYAFDGHTALIAPPGDVDGLAWGVAELLGDDARRIALADAGTNQARTFTWDRSGELLEGHLERYLVDPGHFQAEPGPGMEPPSSGGARLSPSRAASSTRRRAPAEEDLVFNIVWTGVVFATLQYFAASQIAQSRSRFRFVANGCDPADVILMRAFQAAHPDQVTEVLVVSKHDMVAHGVALERVRAKRDDGDWFCFIDPDIKANAPFVGDLAALGVDHAAITSGREVWSLDNFVPEETIGVAGEHFFDRTGFVYGSPHLAIYDRLALDATCARWGIGLGSAGPELRPDAKQRLAEMGIGYQVFDTAKLVNIFLQGDGHRLAHRDLPQLVHIGGLAHFISPPAHRINDDGEQEPDWAIYEALADRHIVSRYTASLLQALIEEWPEPPAPSVAEPRLASRLDLVRREVTDLVARYRADVVGDFS